MRLRRVLVAAMAVAVAVTAGVALAAPHGPSRAPAVNKVSGTRKADHLVGTNRVDVIGGHEGNDRINGRGGRDTIKGGRGNDTINARDGVQDAIYCGPGAHDVAIVDRSEDGVYDCEKVKVPGPGQKKRGSR